MIAIAMGAALVAACSSGGGSDRSAGEDAAATCDTVTSAPEGSTTIAAPTTSLPSTSGRYNTANTPIGTLLADPAARAVLQQYIPSLASSSQVDLIAHTSLKGIQGYASSVLTDELLADIDADLAPLTPDPEAGPLVADVNYDEARVEPYVLPDPFVLADGTPVCDAETWTERRRPEILEDYERLVYGRVPDRPQDEHFRITEDPTPAFDGTATRTQVRVELAAGSSGPGFDLVEYVPADADGPVPMLLILGFGPPASTFGDPDLADEAPAPDLPAGAESMVAPFPTQDYLDAGFGLAAINYLELDPDSPEAYEGSVRAFFDQVDSYDDRPDDAWGAVAAWGWGLSRAMDHLETDPAVDPERVAIYGASRLGRAALWAGARDERFAAVISCCSGKLGGSLLRRNFGDALSALPADWFAPNLQDHIDDIDQLPVDSHLLLGLIAPRPVLLQTGLYDHSADPKGEFLAAVAAGPIYELLGGQGFAATEADWPPTEPVLGDVAYWVHDGGHGNTPEDWGVFLDFLQQHLDDR